MYLAASSDSQAIGLSTPGASLSGHDMREDLLCRLSFEDLGLRVCVDIAMCCDYVYQVGSWFDCAVAYFRVLYIAS